MASSLDRCYKETEEQIEHLSSNLLPTLHEYVLCADNLKVLTSNRGLVVLEHYRDDVGGKDENLAVVNKHKHSAVCGCCTLAVIKKKKTRTHQAGMTESASLFILGLYLHHCMPKNIN